MSWTEIIIGGIIGGGLGGAIVGGIINHYSSKKLDQFHLINESQFRAFSELWKSLTELKNKASELWDNANDITLLSFVNSLKETSDTLEVNALILNEVDYNNLKNILVKFSEYRIGKIRLIDMDKGKIKAERKKFTLTSGARAVYDERLSQISQNEDIKNEYESLLNELRKKFQNNMGIK